MSIRSNRNPNTVSMISRTRAVALLLATGSFYLHQLATVFQAYGANGTSTLKALAVLASRGYTVTTDPTAHAPYHRVLVNGQQTTPQGLYTAACRRK